MLSILKTLIHFLKKHDTRIGVTLGVILTLGLLVQLVVKHRGPSFCECIEVYQNPVDKKKHDICKKKFPQPRDMEEQAEWDKNVKVCDK